MVLHCAHRAPTRAGCRARQYRRPPSVDPNAGVTLVLADGLSVGIDTRVVFASEVEPFEASQPDDADYVQVALLLGMQW